MSNSDEEKRSGRRPEGPAHARKGSPGQTLKRTFTEFKEDELTDRAAALSCYAVLSIFPALIGLLSIVGLVVDPKTITDALTKVVSQIGPATVFWPTSKADWAARYAPAGTVSSTTCATCSRSTAAR